MAAYTKAGYLPLGSDPPENLDLTDVGVYGWHASFFSQKVSIPFVNSTYVKLNPIEKFKSSILHLNRNLNH